MRALIHSTVIAALVCIPFTMNAQEAENERAVFKAVSISPEVNGILHSSPTIGDLQASNGIGVGASFILGKEIGKHFSVMTGLGFNQSNFRYTYSGLVLEPDIDPQLGVISESRIEYNQSITEITVPLNIRYKPFKGNFFLEGGIGLNLQMNADVLSNNRIYFGNGSIGESNAGMSPAFNLSSSFGVGYRMTLAEKIDVSISPVFEYYFMEYLLKDLGANTRTYNIGLRTIIYLNK